MEALFLLIIIGILIVGSFLLYFHIKRQKERTKAFELVAKALGYSFRETDEKLKTAFKKTSIYRSRGSSIRNVITVREEGANADVFEFRFSRGTEESRRVYDQTVYRLRLTDSSTKFPEFLLEPHDFLDSIAKWFGGQSIEFKSFPEFSDRYRLRGENEKMIRYLFNDELVRLLLKRREGLFLEVVGDSMYMYREDHQAKPTKESVQDYFRRYHSIGMAFKKALEESVSIQE